MVKSNSNSRSGSSSSSSSSNNNNNNNDENSPEDRHPGPGGGRHRRPACRLRRGRGYKGSPFMINVCLQWISPYEDLAPRKLVPSGGPETNAPPDPPSRGHLGALHETPQPRAPLAPASPGRLHRLARVKSPLPPSLLQHVGRGNRVSGCVLLSAFLAPMCPPRGSQQLSAIHVAHLFTRRRHNLAVAVAVAAAVAIAVTVAAAVASSLEYRLYYFSPILYHRAPVSYRESSATRGRTRTQRSAQIAVGESCGGDPFRRGTRPLGAGGRWSTRREAGARGGGLNAGCRKRGREHF